MINNAEIQLYRRRYKPVEIVCLDNDKIMMINDDILVTQWNVLRPRDDISMGVSCYYLKEGFKVSKFYDCQKKFAYWYCDIIELEKNGNEYIFNDLLIDVIINTDNAVKIVDLADVSYAYESNLITKEQVNKALRSLDKLLQIIYENKFHTLTKQIELYEPEIDFKQEVIVC